MNLLKNRWGLAMAFGLAIGVVEFNRNACALQIIPTFDSSITDDPDASKIMTTVNALAFEYSWRISDPIIVRILFKKDTSVSLAQNVTTIHDYPYKTVRNALISHATSPLDTTANQSLPDQDNNPVNNGRSITLSKPLARALGLAADDPTASDSTLSVNMPKCKLDPGDAWPFFGYSLYSEMAHEIDEVLGFGSELYHGEDPSTTAVKPADLWRYNQNNARSFTKASGEKAYFYIPGVGRIRQYNQSDNGDDYGDWNDSGARVQDAEGSPYRILRLSYEEIDLLDILGYSLLGVPVWLDLGEINGGNGDYFWAYNNFNDAFANVGNGGAVMIKGSVQGHGITRLASPIPCKLTAFGGTVRLAP